MPLNTHIGEVIVSANKLLGKRNKTIKKLNITEKLLCELEDGTCTHPRLYVSFFALTLRRLVPRKIKLKQLPPFFPTKDKIIAMMNGKGEDLSEYCELTKELLTLPDLPATPKIKKRTLAYTEKRAKKTQKGWGKDARQKAASGYSRRSYGMESQITRKAWGSAFKPAQG